MRLWPFILGAIALIVALFAGYYFLRPHPGGQPTGVASAAAWQRMASPGALSRGHAFLEHNCAACHTPVQGVTAANCIACHANNQSLLQRQPTAFHADVQSCAQCHIEHQGIEHRPTVMDHSVIARLGLDMIWRQSTPNPAVAETPGRVVASVEHAAPSGLPRDGSAVTPLEVALKCATCHGNEDRHQGLFGANCVQCHATTAWTIPQFRHPPSSSLDCAQCHQAPPSHYMMHFEMVSMKAARREHAQVNQCFLCHQTTSWNDIKGVGWYKHH